jgi:hypothetical protein
MPVNVVLPISFFFCMNRHLLVIALNFFIYTIDMLSPLHGRDLHVISVTVFSTHELTYVHVCYRPYNFSLHEMTLKCYRPYSFSLHQLLFMLMPLQFFFTRANVYKLSPLQFFFTQADIYKLSPLQFFCTRDDIYVCALTDFLYTS